MKSLVPIVLVLLSLTSRAEVDRKGNGGNALVCFSQKSIVKRLVEMRPSERRISKSDRDKITKIVALDLIQARSQVDEFFSPIPLMKYQGESPVEFAQAILDRIQDNFPGLRTKIDSFLNLFSDTITSYSDENTNGIRQIFDFGGLDFLVDADSCIVVTIIWHYKGNGKTIHLVVDEELFLHEKHSNYSRGIFYVHEWLYAFAKSLELEGYSTSEPVRDLIAELLREDLTPLSLYQALRASKIMVNVPLTLEYLGLNEFENNYNQIESAYEKICQCKSSNKNPYWLANAIKRKGKAAEKKDEVYKAKLYLQNLEDKLKLKLLTLDKLPRNRKGEIVKKSQDQEANLKEQILSIETQMTKAQSDLEKRQAELNKAILERDSFIKLVDSIQLGLKQAVEEILGRYLDLPIKQYEEYEILLNSYSEQVFLGKGRDLYFRWGRSSFYEMYINDILTNN